MSQPSHNTSTTSGAASGRPVQSEMMKDYLASRSSVTERLVSGATITDQALHQSLRLKAEQLDQLVRQSQEGASRLGST